MRCNITKFRAKAKDIDTELSKNESSLTTSKPDARHDQKGTSGILILIMIMTCNYTRCHYTEESMYTAEATSNASFILEVE